ADRANGGTSIVETIGAAATRPAAAESGTRSRRAIGRTAASSRRRASSSEMVDVNGLMRMLIARLQPSRYAHAFAIHSAFHISHSAFRIPHSTFTPHS